MTSEINQGEQESVKVPEVGAQKQRPEEPFDLENNPGIKRLLERIGKGTGWQGGPFLDTEEFARQMGWRD